MQGAARLKPGSSALFLSVSVLVPFLGEELQNLNQERNKRMNNKAKNSEEPKAAPAYQNRVTLVGYLGRDPEVLDGRAVLSLATKTSWKPKDSEDWQSRTEWHRVTAWGQLAEAVRTFAKGDHVIVEGELRSGQYHRQVPVTGGDVVEVTMKTWEIRARIVRKLVAKAKAPAPVAVAA